MKLTAAELQEGRERVFAKDIDGLVAWVRKHRIQVDEAIIRQVFTRTFLADDLVRANRFFNDRFENCDPAAERLGEQIRVGCLIVVLLGLVAALLGGLHHLIRMVF